MELNSKKLFLDTLKISSIVQILTGIIELFTLVIKVPLQFILIKQLLILEVIVQFIEGGFYVWLSYNINVVKNITPKRYIDWVLTTPTMLITLVLYLIYINEKNKKNLDIWSLLKNNSTNITNILLLNWLMLLFGYLGESKIISTLLGVLLGFIPFILYYLIIFVYYVKNNTSLRLFLYFFIFWSLYGIAALFPYYIKNSTYNILDLFAKNFFGIYLSYIIITKNY